MPEKFLVATDRFSGTRPSSTTRRIDPKNLCDSVANGVGIVSGFVIQQQSPASKKIWISRGLAVGADGKILEGIGIDPSWDDTTFRKNLFADAVSFDLSANLESLSGAYATLNPATHSILVTLDIVNERFRCLKISNAESTAIQAAIGAGETAGDVVDFAAATADHRARLSAALKNPDGVVVNTTGIMATSNVATEFILGVVTLAATGTVTTTKVQRRERKIAWASMVF